MRTLLVLVLVTALPAAAQGTTTLANGMKIIVDEDHSIPSVAMYLFFKVGSRNEHSGITGLSHFFEHMMFNGAKKYGPKEFDNQMERAGGNNNAYTSNDLTVYTDFFPSSALELMFDLESDRLQSLALEPKIVESERGVVYSERRTSVDNNNSNLLEEQLWAAAYTAHPYQWPVVGWPADIESWTGDDLAAYFRMGYAPNNCVLVAVGDTNLAQITALAKKYLEPIARREPPPPVRTKEPEQRGERRVTVVKPAQQPLHMVAFHVPEARHKDSAALRALANVLSQGQSSRLYVRMVDQEPIALSVNADLGQMLDPGLLTISTQVRPGGNPARAEAVLFAELERLRSTPISARELQQAKNQLLVDHGGDLKTIARRANALGRYETIFGDFRKFSSVEAELNAVTVEDVQRVARTYLSETNRTVAVLIPEKAQ